MSIIAAVRPDSWNLALFVHVLGAMILVGGVLTAAAGLLLAHGDERRLRLGYNSLLFVAFPGWVVMRFGATWIWSKESGSSFFTAGFPRTDDPDFVKIGGTAADLGGGLLFLALIVGWFGLRRLESERGKRLLKLTTIISVVLLAAYVLAIWAMAGKP